MTNPRRLAFEVLCDVIDKDEYSNLLLPRTLRDSSLQPRDRAFATELVYGTIRLQKRLDFYIAAVSHRQLVDLELRTLIVLRLGVFQLRELDTPPHAAINETTELAKDVLGKSTASFVHGVLRNADRQRIDLPLGNDSAALQVRYSQPEWIIRALADSRGNSDDLPELLESQNQPAKPVLNALPGRVEEEELINAGASKIIGSDHAFIFDGNPGDLLAVREHRAIVQDRGSQIVVEEFYHTEQLNSGESLRWLDLCAGPGGKAAYLDSLIHKGDFIANEVSKARATLVSNVVRRGRITNFDGRRLSEEHLRSEIGDFDRILIDAPCTGLGALRRRPEVRWRRTAKDLGSLQLLQRELLDSAAKVLREGGIIGYATCSPHLIETKLQVRRFLADHPEFSRVSVREEVADRDGDLQLWTDRDGTDCMFLSLLQKRT